MFDLQARLLILLPRSLHARSFCVDERLRSSALDEILVPEYKDGRVGTEDEVHIFERALGGFGIDQPDNWEIRVQEAREDWYIVLIMEWLYSSKKKKKKKKKDIRR